MVVIRSRKDNRILGMSHTEDGLKFINNKIGKLIYYKDARIKFIENQATVVGDLKPSDKVYVVPYVYVKHKDPGIQRMEDFWRIVYNQKNMTHVNLEEERLINDWLNTKRYGNKH